MNIATMDRFAQHQRLLAHLVRVSSGTDAERTESQSATRILCVAARHLADRADEVLMGNASRSEDGPLRTEGLATAYQASGREVNV